MVDPQRFVNTLRGLPCIGGAISKDIKQAVLPFLDELDESAEKVGAVNTVIVYGNKLKGYNTDLMGFRTAISNGIERSGVPVNCAVVYGYGGVTAVVVSVLTSLGIKVYISGRNLELAKKKVTEFSSRSNIRENSVFLWSERVEADLFINAAPVTDRPLDEATNFLAALSPAKVCFDHEMPGKYLSEYCNLHQKFHISGLDMYYPQMYAQWSLFLKSAIDIESFDHDSFTEALPSLIKKAEDSVKLASSKPLPPPP